MKPNTRSLGQKPHPCTFSASPRLMLLEDRASSGARQLRTCGSSIDVAGRVLLELLDDDDGFRVVSVEGAVVGDKVVGGNVVAADDVLGGADGSLARKIPK